MRGENESWHQHGIFRQNCSLTERQIILKSGLAFSRLNYKWFYKIQMKTKPGSAFSETSPSTILQRAIHSSDQFITITFMCRSSVFPSFIFLLLTQFEMCRNDLWLDNLLPAFVTLSPGAISVAIRNLLMMIYKSSMARTRACKWRWSGVIVLPQNFIVKKRLRKNLIWFFS